MTGSRRSRPRTGSGPLSITRVDLPAKQRAAKLDELRFMPDDDFETVSVVAEYMEVIKLAAGVKLFDEGSKSRHMAIIVDGRVQIQKFTFEEETKVLASLGRGKVIGEMSVIDGEPRSAAAVANAPTTLLIMHQKQYDALVEERPDVAVRLLCKIAKSLSQRLRATSGQLIERLE
jgi:CRP/FNR family cyclic AMP-dependent transcriptional regulator